MRRNRCTYVSIAVISRFCFALSRAYHFRVLDVLRFIGRVGQNRMYTPYMTVYLVIPLPKLPYIHRIYMVTVNPIH